MQAHMQQMTAQANLMWPSNPHGIQDPSRRSSIFSSRRCGESLPRPSIQHRSKRGLAIAHKRAAAPASQRQLLLWISSLSALHRLPLRHRCAARLMRSLSCICDPPCFLSNCHPEKAVPTKAHATAGESRQAPYTRLDEIGNIACLIETVWKSHVE